MTTIGFGALLIVGEHGRARCSGCCRDADATEPAHHTALTGLEGEHLVGCGATWDGVAAVTGSDEPALIAAMRTALALHIWYRGERPWPRIGGAA